MNYLPRTIDHVLQEHLAAFGAVLLEGPKWCGKTTSAEQIAKSVIKLQDPDMREEYLTTAAIKPSLLLSGAVPKLIDEWQDAPVLWDAVRTMVDQRGKPGQFILTGSNAIDKSKIVHSGTGRISRIQMLPMSLWESSESNGKISLQALFDDENADIDGITSALTIEDLIFAACRGGWPATLQLKSRASQLLVARNYIDTICTEDVTRIDGVQRNAKITGRILWSYARNISTLAKKTLMLADITESEDISLSQNTFDDYLSALEKLFVIQDMDGWCPAIRSKTVIRSSPKRCFVDPSIAVAALRLSPDILKEQLNTFGFIFEQMCIRDLRAYSQQKNGILSYYRDRYGLEADGVLHLDDGKYALLEFKLGNKEIEDGAKHLTELVALIKQKNATEPQVPLREPDLLLVITGGKMAYTRPDGVKVIPLGCLKP
ncbi:MAG: ATP-binding protein [Lentisphaerae bacterium]|jgi:predicted AAA+ superfamily ATPase|nr:ATP-binding protein [Lentisphaerota bacterium]